MDTTKLPVTVPGDSEIRNAATGHRQIEDKNVYMPLHRIINPSPPSKAADQHPGQPHICPEVGGAFAHELPEALFLTQDLADHVFGRIVSTKPARDIFHKFVEGMNIRTRLPLPGPLDPKSGAAQRAVQQAFMAPNHHGCSRPDAQRDAETSSTNKQNKAKMYSFRWAAFPTRTETLREHELVSFLNTITDAAFKVAQPMFTTANPELRHRFAAPIDKHLAVPLSCEPDGEYMRPDSVLLPIEAFSEDKKTVDPKYISFKASRLVGEARNTGLPDVLVMVLIQDKAVFLRADGSSTEQLELSLTDGRGCIEFMRILLGLALSGKVDLGHSPDVVLQGERKNLQRATCDLALQRSDFKSNFPPGCASASGKVQSNSVVILKQQMPSSSTKRAYAEVADDNDERAQSKKHKTDGTVRHVDRFIFYPTPVYGRECLSVLFTASSIRGRGSTVFCVVDIQDKNKTNKLLALKTWQDLGRVGQDAMIDHLRNKRQLNLIVPLETLKVERNEKICTTPDAVSEFLADQCEKLGAEDRVLTISVSELKRPVKYFWGVHDFVRGVRGALLGHQYLTEIGISHRDISENSTVLALRPEGERGYLIDFDLAIFQDAPDSKPSTLPLHGKALRTGTFPYVSHNVLRGGKHTHFDDVESFFYVLLLFFFSYAGPLPVAELREADEAGFVPSTGSRRLSHARSWPIQYVIWEDGTPERIADNKRRLFLHPEDPTTLIESPSFVQCLERNWPNRLHKSICNLIQNSLTTFYNSTLSTVESRTQVSHAEFISTLETWLRDHADLEDEFSNCPFKPPKES